MVDKYSQAPLPPSIWDMPPLFTRMTHIHDVYYFFQSSLIIVVLHCSPLENVFPTYYLPRARNCFFSQQTNYICQQKIRAKLCRHSCTAFWRIAFQNQHPPLPGDINSPCSQTSKIWAVCSYPKDKRHTRQLPHSRMSYASALRFF